MSEPKWTDYDDEKLLEIRLCDLGLKIELTEIEGHVRQLYEELDSKELIFHPECYLADEWLCPDEEPIIGIPFYLAHPRLTKLEKKIILEVEGETKEQFMKILRHEAGHAFNYAYKLYKTKKWREAFGSFYEEYPETYVPRPYSRQYVRHLENCYAQYHPDEDFAETFAVWLAAGNGWREAYKGWKGALAKLAYVDDVMTKLKGVPPKYISHKKYWAVENLKRTLAYHYKKKKKACEEDLPGFYDPDLKKIFREVASGKPEESAERFLRRHRKEIIKSVGTWVGKNNYLINRLIKNLVEAARGLRLDRWRGETETLLDITAYINTMVMNYLFTGRLKQWP